MARHQGISWFELLITLGIIIAAVARAGAQPAPNIAPLPPIKTVFIIVEENKNWNIVTALNSPYLRNTLLPMGAHTEQYFNPPGLHPSELNYVWMEAGSSLGITDDADPLINHRNTRDHLTAYLDQAGVSWRAYVEEIDGRSCPLTSAGKFGAKHVPFLFFDDVTGTNDPGSAYCTSHIRPYGELASDLQNNSVARYNFIIPNLCNDMHDCSIAAGDQWLSNEVPKILASSAYQDAGALFITWDEGQDAQGTDSDGPIGLILLSPYARTNYSNSVHYTHSSLLRTLQELFGVAPLLGDAANAQNLSDLFVSGSPGPAAISAGGIVSNASYAFAARSIAPGEIVAVFGSNLTDGGSCLPPSCFPVIGLNGRLNTAIGGTQVLINGNPAPLLYTSPQQLGIQFPSDFTGTSAAVQVAVNGQASLSKVVPVAGVSPGIFTFTADGKGPGAITHADGRAVWLQSPAHATEAVTLYATGLGVVTPAVPTGMLPAGLAQVVAPTSVTVDGTSVNPDFSGLAGCCVGLYQVNFRLPPNVRSADDIPVILTAGGIPSNQVTVAVR